MTRICSFRRQTRTTLIAASLFFVSACTAGKPMELIPTVDRLMLTMGSKSKAETGNKISVDEMLQRVRARDDGEPEPTPPVFTTLTITDSGLSGSTFETIGLFLKEAESKDSKLVEISRPKSEGQLALKAAVDAIRIGNVLGAAGYEVRLNTDENLGNSEFRLSIVEGEGA